MATKTPTADKDDAVSKEAPVKRPPRKTDISTEELKAVLPKFRAGSVVKIRVHRPFHAFAHLEDDDRAEPPECRPLYRDDVAYCPINPDAIANQTAAEMAAMHCKGWFELAN